MAATDQHPVVVINLEEDEGQQSTKQDNFSEEPDQKSTTNGELNRSTPVTSEGDGELNRNTRVSSHIGGELNRNTQVTSHGSGELNRNTQVTSHSGSDLNQNTQMTSHDGDKDVEDRNTLGTNAEKDKCAEHVSVKNYCAFFRKARFPEKIVFIISVTTLVSLSLSLMNIHWYLPFYYAISTPILLVIRVVIYWKNKWQYFLFDFCYFANLFCYIYIWLVPVNVETSVVLFAVANGPLAWATVLFRNALAFHDVDRMTSCYIHILPMVLSFGLRWYPDQMSLHWHGRFNAVYPVETEYMFIWIFAVPLACFMLHSCLYLLVVFGICKPDESYLNSLRYLASRRNSWQGKMLYACGDRCLLLTFSIFNLLYSTLSLLLAVLFYRFYIAHVICISLIVLIVTWNGSTFYIDVFAAKGSKPAS